MRISFIIPVYRVERYIRQCVKSITDQSYKDIELILVDDGSPDNCPQICDELSETDPRIIAIHKSNGGLSDARNYGLKRATGDYVVFVDSDDYWLGTSSLQLLVNIVSIYPDLDFVGFNCKYYYQNNDSYVEWPNFSAALGRPLNKTEALCELVKIGLFPVSACMKLIKRSFIINNQIYFKVGQFSEDIPWFINLIEASNKCIFINEYIYSYRQVSNGTSITHNIGIKNVNSLISIINNELALLPKRSFNKDAEESLLSFLAYELIQAYMCVSSLNKKDAKMKYQELYELNWLFTYTKNPKVRTINYIRKIIGMKLTARVLNYYVKHRS